MAIKKPGDTLKKLLDSMPEWRDQEFAQEFPNVHAFLYDTEYEDGSPRLPGTITIACRNGCLSMALNDNGNNRTLWINQPTWAEMMEMAERSVCDDNADWKAKKVTNHSQKPPF